VKAILFDHDGTLVDSEPVHFQMWCDLLAPHGVSLSQENYRKHHAGMPAISNAQSFVQRNKLTVSAESLADAKQAATQSHLARQGFPLLPGVSDSIALFQRNGMQTAVVTAAARMAVLASLQAHAMEDLFCEIVSLDDVDQGKPAPDGYLFALARLGLGANECIAIEDTEHGVSAAADAGIACLAVPTDMSRHHDFSRATACFDNLAEATQWVVDRYGLTR